MPEVIWIGGPPCSGKTTVARLLARRHGLRLYSADTRTWAHRDLALAAGVEPALVWESLPPAQRWDWPADELLEMSLHAERGAMVLDDLRALGLAPLVVAEGTTLPAALAPAGRSLWLLPTTEFQDAELAAQGVGDGQARLARLLRARALEDVYRCGLPSLVVDGSRTVRQTLSAVEAAFGEELAAGPVAADGTSRRALAREINLDVVSQIGGYHARPWAVGDPDLVTKSFVCECGDPLCVAEVVVTAGEAAARPVLAHGRRPGVAAAEAP